MTKANELEIDRFLFSGGLILDSREFCKKRAGKIFTRKQVEAWQKLSWKGKIPDADVFMVLGGWNCRHILSPVSDEFDLEELQEVYNDIVHS